MIEYSIGTYKEKRNLKIIKAVFFAFLLYMTWFSLVYGSRPVLLYSITVLMFVLIIFDMGRRGPFALTNMPKYIKICFIYLIYSLVSGLFVAKDYGWLLTHIFTFCAYLGVCFCFYYVSEAEDNIKWFLNQFVICGLICSFQILLSGYATTAARVNILVLGEDNNPNTLGLIMVFAVFSLLFDIERVKRHIVSSFLITALFSYVILMTGSRKCAFCLGLFLVGWVWFFIRELNNESKRKITTKTLILYVMIAIAVCYVIIYLTNGFISSSAYQKWNATLSTGAGMDGRLLFYREALEIFKQSPLFGVGYWHFALYSSLGLYSHSTYAEVMSCGGIIGCLIYIVPQLLLFVKLFNLVLIRRVKDNACSIIFILMIIEIVFSFVQITFYSSNHMLILTLIFYWYQKNKNRLLQLNDKEIWYNDTEKVRGE